MADLKISQLTAYTTPLDADVLVVNDTTNSTTKKTTWANIKATLISTWATTFSPFFSTSAGLAALLSDETGSSGGVAVFSASPTIVTPTIASLTNMQHNHTNAAGGGQIPAGSALTGVVGLTNGGTGQTALPAITNAILPSQGSNSGKFLTTDGTNTSWGLAAQAADYQTFTASGTWTKPAVSTNAMVIVEAWGAGGGGTSRAGAAAGGGGGGGYTRREFKASSLGATETVTVATAPAAQTAGGNSTFGSWVTAYGGGAGASANQAGGGGGGSLGAGQSGSGTTGGNGGSPSAATGGAAAGTNSDGLGGAAGAGAGAGGASGYGGGGGAASDSGAGGGSVFGGGGGGGTNGTSGNSAGGTSLFGGNGGIANFGGTGTAGSAPAGGGGAGTTGGAGGRGEIRVWVIN